MFVKTKLLKIVLLSVALLQVMPFGPYVNRQQYGYGYRPMNQNERYMWYRDKYFNHIYYIDRRGNVYYRR